MSPKLFDEWMAYSQLEPFGDEWRQTAELCATSLNAAGGKTGGRPFMAADMHWMPQLPAEEAEAHTAARESAAWRAYALRFKQVTSQEGSATSNG